MSIKLIFDLDLHEIDIFNVWLRVTNILNLVSWVWTLIFGWHEIILFICLFIYIFFNFVLHMFFFCCCMWLLFNGCIDFLWGHEEESMWTWRLLRKLMVNWNVLSVWICLGKEDWHKYDGIENSIRWNYIILAMNIILSLGDKILICYKKSCLIFKLLTKWHQIFCYNIITFHNEIFCHTK